MNFPSETSNHQSFSEATRGSGALDVWYAFIAVFVWYVVSDIVRVAVIFAGDVGSFFEIIGYLPTFGSASFFGIVFVLIVLLVRNPLAITVVWALASGLHVVLYQAYMGYLTGDGIEIDVELFIVLLATATTGFAIMGSTIFAFVKFGAKAIPMAACGTFGGLLGALTMYALLTSPDLPLAEIIRFDIIHPISGGLFGLSMWMLIRQYRRAPLVVAAEGASLNWLSPVASGCEKPPRPRSITIISYVMFISAIVVALGMIAMNVDSNAQKAADAATWMPLQAFYLVGFVSLMVNLICGIYIRSGNNAARLSWIGWSLLGVAISLPDGPALSWASVVVVTYFLSTPKALAYFARRPTI